MRRSARRPAPGTSSTFRSFAISRSHHACWRLLVSSWGLGPHLFGRLCFTNHPRPIGSWSGIRTLPCRFRISLDDSSLTNGPLRVLPGTHRGGVYTDEQLERLAQTTAPVDCVVPSGGVVAMRPLTVHASSKSRDAHPRRVLHIEYAATMNLAPGLELAIA